MESMQLESKPQHNPKLGLVFILLSAAFTSVGQLLWKIADGEINLPLLIGCVCYGAGAITMITAFRFGKLSVLHPLLSLGYVFALFMGAFFLEEHISLMHIGGTALIIVGAILIGGGDN
ncbi:EamA-like transporter family protein [Terribacillus aidingensis]|uniref:EamA-like transporter family protein n=1 Tax=Terribacillus aidingensis TaxID=586416 RepID=A0A285N594_9BACI|nr:EamA family transporter [Terribacillus aidingensis]SNZ04609.1 EamA-like transporter family protein [Terribacillus aidingensis]